MTRSPGAREPSPAQAAARPSRRERPAKPALTRDGIIAAALLILRDEGLGKVTMRRVAQELDTGHASLYVYVRNTEDLHAQLLDALLADALPSGERRPDALLPGARPSGARPSGARPSGELPPSELPAAGGSWRDRLKALLTGYLNVVAAHPEIARMAISTRPSGPHYEELLERILALLAEGGVRGRAAAWALDLLLLYPTAIAAEHAGEARDATVREDDKQLAWLRQADPAAYPHLAALSGELLSGTAAERVNWALDFMLDGAVAAARRGALTKETEAP